ncbi:hypothetical protein RJ218_004613, partial [Enterobacter hormaechei]
FSFFTLSTKFWRVPACCHTESILTGTTTKWHPEPSASAQRIAQAECFCKWTLRARTKNAQIVIIRAMNKHFPQSYNFIPDDADNTLVLFAVVTSTPNVKVTGHIWNQCGRGEFSETSKVRQ